MGFLQDSLSLVLPSWKPPSANRNHHLHLHTNSHQNHDDGDDDGGGDDDIVSFLGSG